MEIVFALLAGVAAIVALVKSGKVRDLLDESDKVNRRELAVLRSEVAQLRRELAEAPRSVVDRPEVASAKAATGSQAAPANPQAAAVTMMPAPAEKVDERPARAVISAPAYDGVPWNPPPVPPAAAEVPVKREIVAPATPPAYAAPQPAFYRESEAATMPAPRVAPVPSAPAAAQPQYSTPPNLPPFAGPPRKTLAERLRATLPLEEVLGMNLFAKIGIVLLVLGFALLGRIALISMGPVARVAMIYAVAAGLLAGGIWLERKERYRLLGRAGIGGGWALLFFTTYAMNHVAAMAVLNSNTADCVLMLTVAIAMVAHTLRYKSQVVTGLAFLLAFSTVAISQDSVYALAAGVILAIGIAAIALRMQWYELEVFGIAASFANHFYWLYKLYPDGVAGHAFPQFWPSAIILVLYWAIFRASYLARAIRNVRDESVSTIAALLNPVLLLAVMKFQSTRPELAFYALLGLGAAEFLLGQIPARRGRRVAFKLLTVLGTILIFASVPFKFSGNSIALFWMIAAELLLVAGIIQPEVVFRRLGLIAGTLTGLLIVYEARNIVELRQSSEAPLIQSGVLLLSSAVVFCVNAQLVRRRWAQLFDGLDAALASVQGYLGATTAFFGVWAIFTADWTALGWAALFLAACAGKRYRNDNHLMVQAGALGAAVLVRCAVMNCHFDVVYPHHVAGRLLTLPILAFAFYAAGWILAGVEEARWHLRLAALWSGSLLLAVLAWLDVSPAWVAPVWVSFAVALVLVARRWRIAEFSYQEHVLAVAAAVQLASFNLNAPSAIARYLPLLGCGFGFYAISRFCTLKGASYGRFAAWAHTWAATALIAALAWHESPQPWLGAIWAVFALTLALVDRFFSVEELPYQAHLLALLAVLRAVTFDLYLRDTWHGVDLRLIAVCILIGVLYSLARWVRLPESLRVARARHAYTWIASGLAGWLMWCELRAVAVALGWAVLGLLLFEIGTRQKQRQLVWQAFVALAAAFGRIFFVNLTANALPGEMLSPRIYTIVPMVLIYFYIWTRLRPEEANGDSGRWSVADLIAYFGTGCVAALLYFQTTPEWIIVAWSVLCLALLLTALLLDRAVFLQQAILLVAGVVARSLAHNLFGASYFLATGWTGKFSILSITAGLLLGGLPMAYRLRARFATRELPALNKYLALKHPEQVFFFAPIVLVTLMIVVKMNPGMVTLSWGIEGVAVILLGLVVSERSYRLTGLILLLLCVGKIVVRDAWLLGERDRYTTFIVLGAALTLVSMLYGKYRETVRRLL